MTADPSKGDSKKRKRISKACDTCRKRKIRCDGDEPCSHCAAHNTECTYPIEGRRKPVARDYVDKLEARLKNLESLLKSVDLNAYESYERHAGNSPSPPSTSTSTPAASLTMKASVSSVTFKNEDDGTNDLHHGRYIGPSSSIRLASSIEGFEESHAQCHQASLDETLQMKHLPYFERRLKMELSDHLSAFVLPHDELMISLLAEYWSHSEPFFPFVHRPSFNRAFEAQDYDRDPTFKALIFAMLAIGSTYSQDPRVYSDQGFFQTSGDASIVPPDAAGFAFAYAALKIVASSFNPPTLYSMQTMVLVSAYSLATLTPMTAIAFVSLAVRLVIDCGAHRNKIDAWNRNLVVDECRKRAVWAIYVLDKILAAGLGRPAQLDDAHLDIDYPLCASDDELEILNNMDLPWPRQLPAGHTRAGVTGLEWVSQSLKLHQIANRVLSTVYAIKKPTHDLQPDDVTGIAKWQHKAVAELDTALEAWYADMPDNYKNRTLPPILPNGEVMDTRLYKHDIQVAVLHIQYYSTQILIHRDLINPSKASSVSWPSVAICTNAARASLELLDGLKDRKWLAQTVMITPWATFTAALVLLYTETVLKKNEGQHLDPLIYKGIEILQSMAEQSWPATRTAEALRTIVEFSQRKAQGFSTSISQSACYHEPLPPPSWEPPTTDPLHPAYPLPLGTPSYVAQTIPMNDGTSMWNFGLGSGNVDFGDIFNSVGFSYPLEDLDYGWMQNSEHMNGNNGNGYQ